MAVSTVHASHATCTSCRMKATLRGMKATLREGCMHMSLWKHVTSEIVFSIFNNYYVRSLCSAYFCGWFFLHWVSTYQQLLSTELKLQSEFSKSLSTFHLPAAARYCHSRQWWETRRLQSCFHPKGTKSLNHRCQYKVQILAQKNKHRTEVSELSWSSFRTKQNTKSLTMFSRSMRWNVSLGLRPCTRLQIRCIHLCNPFLFQISIQPARCLFHSKIQQNLNLTFFVFFVSLFGSLWSCGIVEKWHFIVVCDVFRHLWRSTGKVVFGAGEVGVTSQLSAKWTWIAFKPCDAFDVTLDVT